MEAIEAIEMIARVKYKHHQDENDRGNREYWRREKALDEALKNTFPASDPVSVERISSCRWARTTSGQDAAAPLRSVMN